MKRMTPRASRPGDHRGPQGRRRAQQSAPAQPSRRCREPTVAKKGNRERGRALQGQISVRALTLTDPGRGLPRWIVPGSVWNKRSDSGRTSRTSLPFTTLLFETTRLCARVAQLCAGGLASILRCSATSTAPSGRGRGKPRGQLASDGTSVGFVGNRARTGRRFAACFCLYPAILPLFRCGNRTLLTFVVPDIVRVFTSPAGAELRS